MKRHLASGILGAVLAFSGVAGHHFFKGPDADDQYAELVSRLQTEEGFRARPYRDSAGVWTVGFGTNLSTGLTRDEATLLLRSRLERLGQCVSEHWQPWRTAGPRTRQVLLDMAYELGCAGTLGFHRMLAALARRDFDQAAAEIADSRYAHQVPRRAAALKALLLAR